MLLNILCLFKTKNSTKDLESCDELLNAKESTETSQVEVTNSSALQTSKRLIMLLATCCLGLFIAACLVVMMITVRDDFLSNYEQFSCHQEDQECLGLLCPKGMNWNEEKEECRQPPGWECCSDVQHQRFCFLPETSLDYWALCPLTVKIAGVSQLRKEMCRPGFVWVPRLSRCWRQR